jgi:hypothetical protein
MHVAETFLKRSHKTFLQKKFLHFIEATVSFASSLNSANGLYRVYIIQGIHKRMVQFQKLTRNLFQLTV